MTIENEQYFLPHDRLQDLISTLQQSKYRCVGPQVRDGAIVYDDFTCVDQLPWGLTDRQEAGKYRLEETSEQKAFGWVNGPQAVKPLLFVPQDTLWKVERDAEGKLEFKSADAQAEPVAVFGIRPCDLAAVEIQDKVFIDDEYVDPRYKTRRENLFTIVMNCTKSSPNCFCISAGGSTKATKGFDLAMTEIDGGFVIEAGSESGKTILAALNLQPAEAGKAKIADDLVDQAAKSQTKKLPEGDLNKQLFENLDHPRYQEVAKRCLSCTSCTQVCPTCFCHSEGDKPTLDGSSSEHIRQWDSCFTEGHSYIVGTVLRKDTPSRYRQWVTHKLGSWHDQYGTSGCVGCGRCITWCPAGIDMTEEVNEICKK